VLQQAQYHNKDYIYYTILPKYYNSFFDKFDDFMGINTKLREKYKMIFFY